MADRCIFLTGGSGRLGAALQKVHPCIAPSHAEMPIEDAEACKRTIARADPDVIVHCAGFVNTLQAEFKKSEAWLLNVIGSRNVVRAAGGRRLIYISTEYVFDGELGGYSERDTLGPINYYGLTKLAGESTVLEHPNVLVLRAPFRAGPPWPYASAFTDQWTSSRFIGEVAVDIIRAALMDIIGVLHIGGPRRQIYEMARAVSPHVGRMVRADMPVALPRDVSLDSTTWKLLSAR